MKTKPTGMEVLQKSRSLTRRGWGKWGIGAGTGGLGQGNDSPEKNSFGEPGKGCLRCQFTTVSRRDRIRSSVH